MPRDHEGDSHAPVVHEDGQARSYASAHATIDTHDAGWEGSTFSRSDTKHHSSATPGLAEGPRARGPSDIRASGNPHLEAHLAPTRPKASLTRLFFGALVAGAVASASTVWGLAQLRTEPPPTAPPIGQPAVDVVETSHPAAPSRPSTVHVRSNRRTLVKVNGEPRDYSPLDIVLPPGTYRIAALLPGKPDSERAVRVEVGPDPDIPVDFQF